MYFCKAKQSKAKHLCFLQSKKHSVFPLSRCPYILLVLNIFQRKMFSNAYIFQRKMFSKTKCYKCILATHQQNVTNAFDAKMHLMPKCILAYIFQRKMFSVHFPKENVQLCKNAFDALQKCIFASNAFDAKMHFCNAYIFLWKMFSITFSKGKCSASHFPKENVQHHIFQRKMFSKAKC